MYTTHIVRLRSLFLFFKFATLIVKNRNNICVIVVCFTVLLFVMDDRTYKKRGNFCEKMPVCPSSKPIFNKCNMNRMTRFSAKTRTECRVRVKNNTFISDKYIYRVLLTVQFSLLYLQCSFAL